ncbi:unnamed protein product [Penicillium discolor]
MPKPTKGPRLGGGPAHERLLLANLAAALYTHKSIKTTETKAKRLRPLAERLITFAKRGDLHARRRVLSVIGDKEVVHVLFNEIAPLVADREGGYTRITKVGNRKGDNAPMAVIELVLEPVTPKAKSTKKAAAAPKDEKPAAEEAPAEETVEAPADETPAEDTAAEAGAESQAEGEAAEAAAEDAVEKKSDPPPLRGGGLRRSAGVGDPIACPGAPLGGVIQRPHRLARGGERFGAQPLRQPVPLPEGDDRVGRLDPADDVVQLGVVAQQERRPDVGGTVPGGGAAGDEHVRADDDGASRGLALAKHRAELLPEDLVRGSAVEIGGVAAEESGGRIVDQGDPPCAVHRDDALAQPVQGRLLVLDQGSDLVRLEPNRRGEHGGDESDEVAGELLVQLGLQDADGGGADDRAVLVADGHLHAPRGPERPGLGAHEDVAAQRDRRVGGHPLADAVGLAERVLLERPGGDAGGEGHQEHDQRLQREQLHTERHLRGHGSILPGGRTGREPPAEVFTTNSYGTRPMVSEA